MQSSQQAGGLEEWQDGAYEHGVEEQEIGEQMASRSYQKQDHGRSSHMSRSASKSRYNQNSLDNEGLVAERKNLMSKIFQFYTSFGERTNLKNLRSNKFHKMMQDCSIPISKTSLDLMFVAENHHK